MVTTKGAQFRTWLILWMASLAGVIAVLPYLRELLEQALQEDAAASGISLEALLALQALQSAVLLALACWIGLWAARRIGLGAPIVEALAERRTPRVSAQAVAESVLLGLLAGACVVALDLLVFAPPDAAGLTAERLSPVNGLLASIYGAISEEVLMRLCLLSLLALALRSLFARRGAAPLPGWIFWTANVMVAVLFGIGHLPATAALVPLTAGIVARAIVLNGLLALLFGVLYRRHGLEMAMVAHFAADIVLHVLTPLLI